MSVVRARGLPARLMLRSRSMPPALVGHRRYADIAGALTAVGEGSVKHLAHQHRGDVRADAAYALKSRDLLGHLIVGSPSQRLSALGFHLADQFQSQYASAPQAVEFDPQQGRQCAAVTGAPLGDVALPRAQRRPLPDALCEQQRLYPVLDTQPLLDKVFTLTVRPFGILLFRRRHTHHAANLPISGQPGGEHAKHALGVEPVGLGPAGAAVHQDAGRLEHLGSDAVHRQRSVQPEPVPGPPRSNTHLHRLAQLGRSAPA